MNIKEFETKQEEAFDKMFKWTDFSGDIGGYVLVKETSKYGTEETERQELKSFLREDRKLLLEEVVSEIAKTFHEIEEDTGDVDFYLNQRNIKRRNDLMDRLLI